MDLMLSSYPKCIQEMFKFSQMYNQDYIVLRVVLESFFLKILLIFDQIQVLHLIEPCLFYHRNLNPYCHLLDLIYLSIFNLINYCLSLWYYYLIELYFFKSSLFNLIQLLQYYFAQLQSVLTVSKSLSWHPPYIFINSIRLLASNEF